MTPKVPFQGPLTQIEPGPYEDQLDFLEDAADWFDDDTEFCGIENPEVCESCQ